MLGVSIVPFELIYYISHWDEVLANSLTVQESKTQQRVNFIYEYIDLFVFAKQAKKSQIFLLMSKDWEEKILAHTHGSIEGIFISWSDSRESREISFALPEPRELRREAPGAPAGGRVR